MEAYLNYSIRHTSLRLELVKGSGRPKFIYAGKPLLVEAAAKEYLRDQNWWVVRGEEASLFLSVLSANITDSFFAEVCRNYIGNKAKALIKNIENLCQQSLSRGILSQEHISSATDFLCKYYSSLEDHERIEHIARKVASLSANNQLILVKAYRAIGYFTKGIPDLFAVKNGEFMFAEVKSEGDALRPEQYTFAETILPEAPEGFHVIRVLGQTGGNIAMLANPADQAGKIGSAKAL